MFLRPDGDNPLLWAFIDWRIAKRGERLETVEVLWESRGDPPHYPTESQTGTRITLRKLKNHWGRDAIQELGKTIWTLRSPFNRLTKDTNSTKDTFEVKIEAPGIMGAKAAFNDTLRQVLSNWQARIWGNLENGRSGNRATISVEFRPNYPEDSPESVFQEHFRSPSANGMTRRAARFLLLTERSFESSFSKAKGKQPGG